MDGLLDTIVAQATPPGRGGGGCVRLSGPGAATIAARRGADPETSWTAKLLSKGPEKCAEKFGEEAVEAIIEAVKGDPLRLTAEAADVAEVGRVITTPVSGSAAWIGALGAKERIVTGPGCARWSTTELAL